MEGLLAFSAAFAVGIAALGSGFAMGKIAGASFESIARQPEVSGTIRTLTFVALAFAETLTIYGLLVAFLLMGKI